MDEKTIFLSNNKNEFYSIDTTTGLINWKNQINSILTPPVSGKFIITVSDNGFLYIIEKKTGNIFSFSIIKNHFSMLLLAYIVLKSMYLDFPMNVDSFKHLNCPIWSNITKI